MFNQKNNKHMFSHNFSGIQTSCRRRSQADGRMGNGFWSNAYVAAVANQMGSWNVTGIL